MMSQDQDHISEAESQRERRMRRAVTKEKIPETTEEKVDDSIVSEISINSEQCSTPRISRESILRNLKKEEPYSDEISGISSLGDSSPLRPLPLDPDVPIPSLESDDGVDHDDVLIKEEEQEIDLYDIPEYHDEDNENDGYDHAAHENYDDESQYSRASKDDDSRLEHFEDAERQSTPVPMHISQDASVETQRISQSVSPMPEDDHQLNLELLSYVDRSTPPVEISDEVPPALDMMAIRDSPQRPETPEQGKENGRENEECPGTPESVIRHPVSDDTVEETAPIVPEPVATVKAPGAGLKTRPSLTPADAESMAAVRRKVSGQAPRIPSISEHRHHNGSASELTFGSVKSDHPTLGVPGTEKRHPSLVKLDIPVSAGDEGLGFGIDEEFDRVLEAQKVAFELPLSQIPPQKDNPYFGAGSVIAGITPEVQQGTLDKLIGTHADAKSMRQRGYLMRQNTKVIVATSHGVDDVGNKAAAGGPTIGNTPRKASQQTWTTEPWNPKARRQSIKLAGAAKKKNEPVPPLPGQESVVKDGLTSVDEADANGNVDDVEDGKDRGRLFVKVVGVKDLDLPLPRGKQNTLVNIFTQA